MAAGGLGTGIFVVIGDQDRGLGWIDWGSGLDSDRDQDQNSGIRDTHSDMSDRVYWSALIVGALASVAVLAGMAAHWVVFGSLEGRWAYHYVFSPVGPRFSIGVIAATAAAAALALPAPRPGKA